MPHNAICEEGWRYYLPDNTHGSAWVCETNRDVILAIFWISLVQLFIASVSFVGSFFSEDDPDLFSADVERTVHMEDPEVEIRTTETNLSKTPVIIVNKKQRQIVKIYHKIHTSYGPRIHEVINVLAPILGLCAVKVNSLEILEAFFVFTLFALFVGLIVGCLTGLEACDNAERFWGADAANWVSAGYSVGIIFMTCLNLSMIALSGAILTNRLYQ
ncbi:unnamed protein product [Oikopleura dioica]|uniref:Uncharacterized protein n=1 Tax=Oikopleura dioica TaxID=34765 RepID=E4YBN1_OIKDI|nr:unnamed protein product [Oikopleura dioica]